MIPYNGKYAIKKTHLILWANSPAHPPFHPHTEAADAETSFHGLLNLIINCSDILQTGG